MKKLSIKEITKAVNGTLISGDSSCYVTGVSHDSRTVGSNDIFFPIVGETHDGHKFINNAIERGCKVFVYSNKKSISSLEGDSISLIKVENTTKALADLAKYYLEVLNLKIIGVTGSTGKTSTKDMVSCVMASKYKTGVTKGNFNNEIGLPLTVLGFEECLEVAVLEMGMDHAGEISYLADIAKPDIGIITNIGVSHIENFSSREGIFKAKMEITNSFTKDNTLIVSEGEDFLKRGNLRGDYETIITGTGNDCDYKIENFKTLGAKGISFELHKGADNTQVFTLPVQGKHNALNASLAIAAGGKLGISMKEAAAVLANLKMTGGRLEIEDIKGVTIIDDTYNASPDSMKSAIDVLMSMEGNKKIAVLGDMLELGENTEEFHSEVGQYAARAGVDILFTYGDLAKNTNEGFNKEVVALQNDGETNPSKGTHYNDKMKLSQELSQMLKGGEAVLFKGSRGMKMETIKEEIARSRK